MRFAFFIFFLALFSRGSAQTSQITVHVQNEKGLDVPYAEVLINAYGNQNYEVADEFGIASFKTSKGALIIEVFAIGYQDYRAPLSIENQKEVIVKLTSESELLNDAVVTAQYQKRSARSAVEKIEIIDSRTLESRSSFNLREAIMLRMNVQVRQDNSTGSALSLMGISGQNVKILIDGVPVIGRLDGNIDLSQINMNDVERIEVIEGPVSTNYGTNALAGVINIITKKSSSKELVGFDAYWESIGQYNANIRTGTSFGKHNLRLAGGRNFFQGWSPEETGRWNLWKPKEQYFARAIWSWKKDKTELSFKSEYFDEYLLNQGRALTPYFESAFDEKFKTKRVDQHFHFSKQVSPNRMVDGFVAYNYYTRKRNTFFKDLVTLEVDPVTVDGTNDTTNFRSIRSRSTYSFSTRGKRLNYQFGYDVGKDWATGLRIEDGEKDMTDVALFGSAEYKITNKLVLKPGLRGAWNSQYDAPLIPMLSARYRWGKYALRASWSKGFRAPDIKELYIFFVDVNHNVQGNPNLQAEESNNVMLSVTGLRQLKKGFLKPSISAFYNHITDKINLANIRTDLYTYVNVEEFRSAGGRINLNWLDEKTKINTGFGWTAINNGLGADPNDFYNYLELSAGLQTKLKGIDVSISSKFNGKQQIYVIDAETAEVTQRSTREYTFIDLQLSRRFLSDNLRVNIGVKNLLNVGNIQSITAVGGAHGSESVAIPVGTGRGYFVKMGYQIRKQKE